MAHKADRVLAAAHDLFMRYGYTRVTMGDIAREAGMSRPALYLVFPGKEDIFNAVVEAVDRRGRDALMSEITQFADMYAQLCHVCTGWFGRLYDLQQRVPDARDMDDLSFPVVGGVYERLQVLLASILITGAAKRGVAVDASALARILVFSIRGFRASARDGDDYREMIEAQVGLVAGVIDGIGCQVETPAPAV